MSSPKGTKGIVKEKPIENKPKPPVPKPPVNIEEQRLLARAELRRIKAKKSKVRRPFYFTKQIAEYYEKETELKAGVKDFIIYLVYLICAIIHADGLRSRDSYFVNLAFRNALENTDFKVSGYEVGITFKEISTISSIWLFLEHVVLDIFYQENFYDNYNPVKEIDQEDRAMFFCHTPLGVGRIRQVKTRNDSCTVPQDLTFLSKICFDTYSEAAEQKEPFGTQGEGWTHITSNDWAWYDGYYSSYPEGGFYKDLPNNRTEAMELLSNLKHNVWITPETRAVFVDFSFYDFNTDVFGRTKIIFEIGISGNVYPAEMSQSFPYPCGQRGFLVAFDYIFYIFTLYFIFEEVLEIWYLKKRYFYHVWTYIDLTMIVIPIICFTYFLTFNRTMKTLIEKHKPGTYLNADDVFYEHKQYLIIMGWQLFLQYIRMFKCINVIKAMGQINNTIKKSIRELLLFLIMFFIIFFAYAVVGVLLFGFELRSYRTFGWALFTLLMTVIGEFDYNEMKRANGFWAPVFFISYIFFVFFILLNMFVAIIIDHYTEVKTDLAIAPPAISYRDALRLLCPLCFKPKIKAADKDTEYKKILNEIRSALSDNGFSDLDIQMFFIRFNINTDPNTQNVTREDVLRQLEGVAGIGEINENAVKTEDLYMRIEQLEQIEKNLNRFEEKVEHFMGQLDLVG